MLIVILIALVGFAVWAFSSAYAGKTPWDVEYPMVNVHIDWLPTFHAGAMGV